LGDVPAAAPAALSPAASVSGRVTLAPELLARTSPGDTVFIVARAAEGPRMPLAVLRKRVSDLPLDFKLDDSMAMAPNAKISDHPKVVVSARISKSGEAAPKEGDLAGQSAAVAPGASSVAVQITDVVKP
jgi:cytochrome c-type biogenesis protein CcmH